MDRKWKTSDSPTDVTDGMWGHLDGWTSEVPCWTCRRRRLRCDNVKPSCVKCTRAGIECLGYSLTKPLIWIAKCNEHSKKGGEATKEQDKLASVAMTRTRNSQRKNGASSNSRHLDSDTNTNSLPTNLESLIFTLSSPRTTLISPVYDPIIQELGNQISHERTSRIAEYMDYYNQRCCMECSIYEENSLNPFRQFLTLAQTSPLLCHTVVSLAAYHRARSPLSFLTAYSDGSSSDEFELDDLQDDNALQNLLSNPHYVDAIYHKGQAIRHLQTALAKKDHSDSVIISALLLIWIELLESGSKSWKDHLNGMKYLLSYRPNSSFHSKANSSLLAQQSLSGFEEYFQEIFITLQTFGCTFSRDKLDTSTIFDDIVLDEILQRAEMRTWTGCPAELLRVLCTFNSLAARQKVQPDLLQSHPETTSNLFAQLESFHCLAWANHHPDLETVRQRYNLARAYKTAIKVYGHKLFRTSGDLPGNMNNAVNDGIVCLTMIDSKDIHFKGCLWPTFVLGAESRHKIHRFAVNRILHAMYNLLQSKSIQKAILALERLWKRDAGSPNSQSWLEILYDEGEELHLV